jgi:hypothetical protein
MSVFRYNTSKAKQSKAKQSKEKNKEPLIILSVSSDVEQTLHTDSVTSSLSLVGNLAGELGVRCAQLSNKIESGKK